MNSGQQATVIVGFRCSRGAFARVSTRWKQTRAKARDYNITAAFGPNEEFFTDLLKAD
jgi:hypothetical protein